MAFVYSSWYSASKTECWREKKRLHRTAFSRAWDSAWWQWHWRGVAGICWPSRCTVRATPAAATPSWWPCPKARDRDRQGRSSGNLRKEKTNAENPRAATRKILRRINEAAFQLMCAYHMQLANAIDISIQNTQTKPTWKMWRHCLWPDTTVVIHDLA